MKSTDVRVVEATVEFTDEKFRTPFKLSTGIISTITYAAVKITVENRRGQRATGRGGILLSDLWAFPSSEVPHSVRDKAMRLLVERCIAVAADTDFADPLQIGAVWEKQLSRLLQEVATELRLPVHIPRLAGLVCLSPVDAALHDAWSCCAGQSAYRMYTGTHLNEHLGHYLGDAFRGEYAGQYLRRPRQRRLAVQHVVGVSDPLTEGDLNGTEPRDGLPNSLEQWVATDGVHWLKVKVTGQDLSFDVERIAAVYAVGKQALNRLGDANRIQLGVDPNEACAHPDYLLAMLAKLREKSPAAYEAITYIEQPTARDLTTYDFTLHEVARQKPVLADESLDDLTHLPLLLEQGWSGVALKSCKGQGHALLTYSWAKKHGLYVTVQDLTNPGCAFVHSANLAAHLNLDADCIEYNSRQYAPHSRADERRAYASLFRVADGHISLDALTDLGLY